jgi:hypothetical protein
VTDTGTGTDDVQFTIQYDEAVMRSAVNTFMKRRLSSGLGALGVLAVAVTIVALVFLLWDGDRSWVVGAVGTVLLLFVAIFGSIWRWRHVDMQDKIAAIPSKQAVVTLANESMSIETEAGATSLPWTTFTELWQLERSWLLFLAPNNFITLPTDGVSVAALDYLEGRLHLLAHEA